MPTPEQGRAFPEGGEMADHNPEEMRRLMRVLLEATGTSARAARTVADGLVEANLAGHDSHGVIRILAYLDQVREGQLDVQAEPEVISRRGATATIDGKWGWGQPAMWLATEEAARAAKEHGLGMATVVNSYHIGRLAPYVESLARRGLVGLLIASAGPAVAPWGGTSRVMGTNPIAWAVPRGDGEEPICLDIATSTVAEGKLRVARAKGVPVRPGLIVDDAGNPTLDPNDFYNGGALLAFGEHKGSGFSVLAQLLGAGLTGMTTEKFMQHRGSNGPLIIAIDVEHLVPMDGFLAGIEREADKVLAARPMDGVDAVQLPGDPELVNRAHRREAGIPVPDSTWDELMTVARDMKIDESDWRLGEGGRT